MWGHVVAAICAETPEQRERREAVEAAYRAWWAGLTPRARMEYRLRDAWNATRLYVWNLGQAFRCVGLALCGRDFDE